LSSTDRRGLLATYLKPELPRAALLGAFLATGIGLQLANPLIARAFIDDAQAGQPFGRLLRLAFVFTAVAFVTQVATVAETYAADNLGWRTTNTLRVDLLRRVLGLDSGFHAGHSPGELVERVDGDVSAIAGFFSRFVVQVVGNAMFLLGVLAVVFAIDWRIGALLGFFAAGALTFMTRGGGTVATRSRRARAAVGALSGFLEERLVGLPDIKANGGDGWAMTGLSTRMAARYATARSSVLAASSFSSTISLVFVTGTGAALALGAELHRLGLVSVGTVFAVFRYTTMLRFPLEQLSRQMNNLQQATGGMVRVRELLDTRPAVDDGPGVDFASGALGVELADVSFSYAGPPVLEDVSFRVDPGEVLGILGRTGSGKTTVARLVYRLHDPAAGAVRIDGRDIRQARLDQLRTRVALVTQDVQLFHASLRDNVALFDPRPDDARLLEAFAALGLGGWLERLPAGLSTVLGPGGSGLSAGEAQLVALARVFLADPGVVLLDEASSRLDPASERLVETGMDHLLAGRTGLVIAHRLTTVARADRIIVLEAGRVVESGRRADLAGDPTSRFSHLSRLATQGEVAVR